MILEPNTVVAALALELHPVDVAADQRVAGTPTTALVALSAFGEAEVGVWEMTPGAMTDVETDEIFIVIAGRARIDFSATGESVEIGPGFVGRFAEGAATVWTVTETLRKIYVA
jgi:uncharacterized cupin superfamily protein